MQAVRGLLSQLIYWLYTDFVIGKPLPMRDAPNAPMPEPEIITNATIYDCIAAPPPERYPRNHVHHSEY